MRVIAGTLKGRRLQAPTWDGLRPTSDKLRETMFNLLAPYIQHARVMDGFAGTGALGIEALSRGADSVVFIESDPRAQALIAGNLAQCRIETGYTVLRVPVERGLELLRTAPTFAPFDIMILDPPYNLDAKAALAGADAVLARGGTLVLEHARKRVVPAAFGGLLRLRQVHSGDSTLTLYTFGTENCEPGT